MSVNPTPRAAGGDSASGDSAPPKIRHRPSWIAFVVLGAIFCLGMGFWQLARYQEATGTVQNLGYTFMWPFLAGFLVYAYYKYVRLEADEQDRAVGGYDVAGAGAVGSFPLDEDDDDNPAAGSHPPAAGSRAGSGGRGGRRGPVMTEIPADLLPTRRPSPDEQVQDEGLAAYNSYLAELARQDGVVDRSQEKPAS